ncbi:Protein RtcB [Pseudonocardia sp. Ae717_Ps2]|nr:Protein RtcB [Pseudonocardia sp. Ae717_Ps2]
MPTELDWAGFWRGFDRLHHLRDASWTSEDKLRGKAHQQLGSLGGGNHFVELCLDGDDRVWLMLHSGSRGIGNILANLHIEKAKVLPHNQELPDRDLAVFLAGTPADGTPTGPTCTGRRSTRGSTGG